MKLTQQELKQIIKEEVQRALKEARPNGSYRAPSDRVWDAAENAGITYVEPKLFAWLVKKESKLPGVSIGHFAQWKRICRDRPKHSLRKSGFYEKFCAKWSTTASTQTRP